MAVALLAAGCAAPTAVRPAAVTIPESLAEQAALRERIARERQAALQAYEAQARACYQRFAVNDCLSDARASRRNRLDDLRRHEIALNDAERQRKAAAQLQRTERLQGEQQP